MGAGSSELKPNEEPSQTETRNTDTRGSSELQPNVETSQTETRNTDTRAKIVDESHERAAQVKAKPPHNYQVLLRDADSPVDTSSMDKLHDQLSSGTGILLNQKRKKYWVDKNSKNCFFLYARNLTITWVEDKRYWQWRSIQETRDEVIDVAELLNACWLEVHGKFQTANLSPGTLYEVAFVVKLKDPAYGWEVPVTVRLTLPDGNKQEHKENLMKKLRGDWIEIPVGEFVTSPANTGEIEFSIYEYEGGEWKRGLVIKGITIRPKY